MFTRDEFIAENNMFQFRFEAGGGGNHPPTTKLAEEYPMSIGRRDRLGGAPSSGGEIQ
jgi:hypothetical protein